MSSLEQLKCRDAFAAVKENIPAMARQLEAGALLFSTPQEPLPKYGEYDYRHQSWELLAALAGMLRKGVPVSEEAAPVPVPRPIVYSVRDKGRQLIGILRARGRTSLRELYAMAVTRSELVATFLSLLTMCSQGNVTIDREGEDYAVRFTGGDEEAILESFDYG